jgi:hypothetical protein
LIAAVVAAFTLAAPAQASGWVHPHLHWAYSGTSDAHIWGEAYGHDFGCGLADCAEGSNLYLETYRFSGPSAAEAEVNGTMIFDGVGLDVSVSYPAGISFGFSDGGSNCNHGYWYAPGNYVTVDFGSGVICDADTWGWISDMKLAMSGGLRIGGSWSVRSASACTVMGAGGC